MPDYTPNPAVRAFAVLALVAAFVLVVAVVITSGGDSDDDDAATLERTEPSSRRGEQAVKKGVWVVREGDTLGKISAVTEIDSDVLIQLNPDLDPQALLEGQRIALR
jgi:LysM repeat protein